MMSILLFLDTYTPSMEELAMRSPSSLYLIDINQGALPQTRFSSNFYTFDSNPHASPGSFELMASVAHGQSRADATPFRETSTILCSSRQERCAAVSGPPCGGVVFPFTSNSGHPSSSSGFFALRRVSRIQMRKAKRGVTCTSSLLFESLFGRLYSKALYL
jgi:hypothetical protein